MKFLVPRFFSDVVYVDLKYADVFFLCLLIVV